MTGGYGKHFESMYSGSMYGAGAMVFAVWGWVISNARDGQVEINPRLLASVLGESKEDVAKAIAFLCAEDPQSRSSEEGGRRLVPIGQFLYRVVTHEKYTQMLARAALRDAERDRKREQRARLGVSRDSPGQPGTVTGRPEAEAGSESVPDPGDPEPRQPSSAVVSHAKADAARTAAFAAGFDTRRIAAIFSRERKAVGRGAYALDMSHHGPAESALAWAVAEVGDPSNAQALEAVVQDSIRGYLCSADEDGFLARTRWPFTAWAKDAGAWLAVARRAPPRQRPPQNPKRPDEDVTPPAEAAAAVKKIINDLRGRV